MRKTRKKMSKGKRLLFMGVGVLLVIAALIAVIFIKKEIDEKKAEESSSYKAVLLEIWKYEEKDIAQVRVHREDETVSLLSKKDDDGDVEWYLEEYPDADLSSAYLNTIITAMVPQAYELVVEGAEKSELKQYGLDDPYAIVEVTLQDGTIKALHVGNKSVSGTRCYIMDKDSNNVYSTNSTVLTYVSYTTLELYDADITSVYSSYTLKYLFAQEKGKTPVEIEHHLFDNDPYNYYQVNNASYRFLQPFNYKNIGVMNKVQAAFISGLEAIEYTEIIELEATEDKLEEYGLGEEPEHRVNIIVYKVDDDEEVTEFETDYYFGKTYGENDEYVYFREADSDIVFGIEVKYRDQFVFDPLLYRQGLLYVTKIDFIETLEIELFGETYEMTFKPLEQDEESEVYNFESTLNGMPIEERKSATGIVTQCFMIMTDKIFLDQVPEYDANKTIKIRYTFQDGTKKDLTFYQHDGYFYSIELDEGVWANCEITQFQDLETVLQRVVDSLSASQE